MQDNEEYDKEKIQFVILAIICIVVIIGGIVAATIIIQNKNKEAPIKQLCENNPTERYSQPCNGAEDCIKKCIGRVKEASERD